MPKRYQKSILICSVAAALLLAAWFVITRLPLSLPPPLDGEGTDDFGHDHGVYLTLFGEAFDGTVTFAPRGGAGFTLCRLPLPARPPLAFGVEGVSAEAQDLEAVRVACVYAANLPALTLLAESVGDLAQYGLDPPLTRVVVRRGDLAVTFEIGDLNPDQTAYYARVIEISGGVSQARPGALYLIDAEAGDRLTLPRGVYLAPRFWPGSGDPGDRPALTKIEFRHGADSYVIERVTPGGVLGVPGGGGDVIASYRMTEPFEFLCNGDAAREKVLAGILDIGLDEYVCDWFDGDPSPDEYGFPAAGRELLLSGLFDSGGLSDSGGWEAGLAVGGPAPGGGRYVRFRDAVYIDRLGGYGFMDVTPLELTYGVPFWLYRLDDVARVEVVSGPETWGFDIGADGYALTLPDGGVREVKELNARRLFARLINFSVAGNGGEYNGSEIQMSVAFHMADGARHELRFYPTVNARLVPVGVDGAPPALACGIKDLQAVSEALALAGQGLAVPAEW